MTPEESKLLIDIATGIKVVQASNSEIKKDIEDLQHQFKKTNDEVIVNKMEIKHLDKRISDNYKNQKEDINGAFSKINHCGISKEKIYKTEKEDIKKYIDDKINISSSSLQNKFYVSILTAIAGILIAILKDIITK